MPLRIRLRREGRSGAPRYRIVIAEGSLARKARFVATIGHYLPASTPELITVDRELALTWIDRGAVPTDTVRSLLRKAGVLQKDDAPAVPPEDAAAVELLAATLPRMADLQVALGRAVSEQAAEIAEFRHWMRSFDHAVPEREISCERVR